MGNLVAIVGRPNVGKSTLFNRLTKTRQAIVNEEAGTTRDRQYGKTEWLGREFSVVDTGGWVVNSDDIFEEEIRKQVLMAVDEADVILFVVDVMNGVTDLDEQVAAILRRAKKPVLLVANKTDNHELQYNAPEFYSLGLGDPYCISAVTGSGTGDMMDLIVSKFKKESDEILDEDIPRFAVVGRPNAGKSSIVNAFIGEDRNIVTEIAGTTRDSIYTRYNKFGLCSANDRFYGLQGNLHCLQPSDDFFAKENQPCGKEQQEEKFQRQSGYGKIPACARARLDDEHNHRYEIHHWDSCQQQRANPIPNGNRFSGFFFRHMQGSSRRSDVPFIITENAAFVKREFAQGVCKIALFFCGGNCAERNFVVSYARTEGKERIS